MSVCVLQDRNVTCLKKIRERYFNVRIDQFKSNIKEKHVLH